ncbi:putative inactive flavonol synthase 2 [Beta vulgaris subsp. vulgaris]|uniref:putative inactive flavonol synthase 2 n=1 Tax=Beta vulgaris subsp. vulgaris TaxID=3555 RepID=UPI002547670E|nr:putative inactive flavonol synthase 2 [Beta vulgaris subsp. vulgaris]
MEDMPSFHWVNDVNPISVTPDYILPQEKRPNLTNLSHLISLPVIDMNKENEILVHEIAKACEEFGFFMLINHGISQELCYNVLNVITNFFYLPQQEKAKFFSTCHMEDGKISRYYLCDDYQATKKKTDLWCEAFYHTWDPFDLTFIQNLPQSPPNYRETIVSYAKEIGPLMLRLLCLISQGLGLSKHYLQRSIILQEQGVTGLHVLKDQQWVAVHPIPASLVVNVADQLQTGCIFRRVLSVNYKSLDITKILIGTDCLFKINCKMAFDVEVDSSNFLTWEAPQDFLLSGAVSRSHVVRGNGKKSQVSDFNNEEPPVINDELAQFQMVPS